MSEWLELVTELREIEAERPCKRLADPGDLIVHDWAYEAAQREHSAREAASRSFPPSGVVWPAGESGFVRGDGSLSLKGRAWLESLW